VRVDAIAVRLRPRGAMDSCDLGVRLCQECARSVYLCYWSLSLPVFALCLSTAGIAVWLPSTLIWFSKPWLDRSILFVLSRAVFGQTTRPRDLWSAQRQVLWTQFLHSWLVRRLSPWRALTQPVYQLEGLEGSERSARLRQIRGNKRGSAALATQAFVVAEYIVVFAGLALVLWLTPQSGRFSLEQIFEGHWQFWTGLTTAIGYAMAVALLEPLYVGAGFGMYLNRRVELEAWDIEQEFRRAFA
jgi:hypothetical protein